MVHCETSRGEKGFTLIEVMIAVAIAALLAAMALSVYRHYQLKSKTAEARANIGTIAGMQTAFFAEWDGYLPCSASRPPPLSPDKAPWPHPAPGFDLIGFMPTGGVYYSYEVAVGGQPVANIAHSGIVGGDVFAVSAVADLDGDGTHGEFVYSSHAALVPRTPQLTPGHAAVHNHLVESLTPTSF